MQKPDAQILDHWINNRIRLQLELDDGQTKHAFINSCYGLGIHVDIDNPKQGIRKNKTIFVFDQIISITSD